MIDFSGYSDSNGLDLAVTEIKSFWPSPLWNGELITRERSAFSRAQYFENGWAFFIPYLFAYFVFWGFRLPVSLLTPAFQVLHFVNVVAALAYFWKTKRQWQNWIFWGVLFLALLWPGAYLEFPADPWEHLRRIIHWKNDPLISMNEFPLRFAYYWSWTLIDHIPIMGRRWALGFVAALWQGLLCFQWYRFNRHVGMSRSWSYLQVAAFVGLFGTNLFSFRYYALSSTPLAYLAYLAFLVNAVDAYQGRRSISIVEVGFQMILMAMNHFQVLLFAAVSGLTILILDSLRHSTVREKKRALLGGAVLLVLGAFCGFYWFQYTPWVYAKVGQEQISHLGSFRLWDGHGRFFETLGVHGSLSLILAVFFFFKYPLLSSLTLAPVILLLFPLSVLAIANTFQFDVPYRMLYTLPTSLMLVLGLKSLLEKFWPRLASGYRSLVFTGCLVFLLALPYQWPWRGRLFFQFHTPSAMRSLEGIDQTAAWFEKNTVLMRDCWFLADDATGFLLSTELGIKRVLSDRIYPYRLLDNVKHMTGLINMAWVNEPHFCGLVYADRSRVSRAPSSKVAQFSGHLDPRHGDLSWQVNRDFPPFMNFLEAWGWRKYSVPPFYTFYEPPLLRLVRKPD